MTFDPNAPPSPEWQAIDAEASLLMNQGISLLNGAQPSALKEALECFDRALSLRSRLPVDSIPMFGYGLAACWLNRADALMGFSGSAEIPAALQAYDEAIQLLRRLPLHKDARFPRRLAIAYQNRGLALQAQGVSRAAEATAMFSDAVATLEHEQSISIPDRQYLLAAIWTNLANVRASETTAGSGPLAREAARRAITLVSELESTDVNAAEVGLKARHVLCQTIAKHLPIATANDVTLPDDVHEATDAADDALHLIREWEQKGIARFRTISYDLFRFGAHVYARYQPQFLDEFIRDNFDPDLSSIAYVESVEMRSALQEVLGLASRAGD